jgi:hypothetical protein
VLGRTLHITHRRANRLSIAQDDLKGGVAQDDCSTPLAVAVCPNKVRAGTGEYAHVSMPKQKEPARLVLGPAGTSTCR